MWKEAKKARAPGDKWHVEFNGVKLNNYFNFIKFKKILLICFL